MSNPLNPAHSDKILVVDDTPANLHLLTNLLKEHGYTVHPASDGELSLRFAQTTLPDLILLDIRMPGMDGYEVCRRLKAEERTASVPIIFISILEDERDKVKGFQMGAVDYITKPFQPEEVLARIKTHLRLRELTERLERAVDERTGELTDANQRLQQEIIERRKAEEELRKLNEELDRRVKERTQELEAKNAELKGKNAELEQMNKLFVGRELRMIELKKRIKELEEKTGEF
jgi:DNA-binding response OmpR family regulator